MTIDPIVAAAFVIVVLIITVVVSAAIAKLFGIDLYDWFAGNDDNDE